MAIKSGDRLHLFFYRLLFVILAGSAALLVLSFRQQAAWHIYHNVYFLILLVYTWYTAILLLIGETRTVTYPHYNNEPIAVLIPAYNEEPKLFVHAIRSVLKAKGNKTIYVIDDGSVRGIDKQKLLSGCRQFGINIHFFETNRGKRHALFHGVKALADSHDFIVTIDSDTILDEDALVRLVEPLKDPRIGASTGDVLLLNEKQNLLTRMIGAYYWVGLQIFKRAQSNLGMVVCCSGCLAGYRSDVISGIIDEFVNQQFLGEPCTHSEDRHLTNLVLREGYDVVFTDQAVSYTSTPSTIKGFLRQQQRWKRGYIREATFTLTYAWKRRPLLFLQILLCELTIPFFAFGLMIALFITIVFSPSVFVTVVLPSWVVFMFIRFFPVIFYGKKKIPGLFLYMFFYEIFLYWQFIYALFTVKNKNWLTRG